MGVLTLEQRAKILEEFNQDCMKNGVFDSDWWSAIEGYDVNVYTTEEYGEEVRVRTKIVLYPLMENGEQNYSDYFVDGYFSESELALPSEREE